MAFSVRTKTREESKLFAKKISDGVFVKDILMNHGEEFKGGGEEISLSTFTQFIGSASHELMKMRSNPAEMGDYLGI